jgi:hypothetical protein
MGIDEYPSPSMTDGTVCLKVNNSYLSNTTGSTYCSEAINTDGISPEDNHAGVDPPVAKGCFDVFELNSIAVCDPTVSGAGLKSKPVDDELFLVFRKELCCLWVVWKQEPHDE